MTPKDWQDNVALLASLLPDDIDVDRLEGLPLREKEAVVAIVQEIKAMFDNLD